MNENTEIIDCRLHSFYCEKSQICINIIYVCDGINDCVTNDDEENCTFSYMSFDCFLPGKKIHYKYVCDGNPDCSNGYDELFCGIVLF